MRVEDLGDPRYRLVVGPCNGSYLVADCRLLDVVALIVDLATLTPE